MDSKTSKEISRRIAQAYAERVVKLDLSGFGLTTLPKEVGRLDSLEQLDLRNNNLTAFPDTLLSLGNLQQLDLQNNGMATLPNSIYRLDNLRLLHLQDNRLCDLPESIGKVDTLKFLCLDNNQLSKLPESIRLLDSLQYLNLPNNKLTILPESIGHLTSLQRLDLEGNQLTALPDSIGSLTRLLYLFLHHNRITALPDAIGRLARLRRLDLDNNLLVNLPHTIGQLTDLQILDLHKNRLAVLPHALSQLANLQEFYLHGNDLLGIPPEVLGPPARIVAQQRSLASRPEDILDYYFNTRKRARPLNEVKLLLVGRGGAGKSSIRDRLIENTFDPEKSETTGIAITHWPLRCNADDVHVHVWDFAGQEITHSTHQFFLTERSVYLLVLDARSDTQHEDAEYWLRLIAAFGQESPVIVLLNKFDTKPFAVDEYALREKHPAIRAFVSTDCFTGHGIERLRVELKQLLSGWTHVHQAIAAPWWDVKEYYTVPKQPYVRFDEFRARCRAHGMTDASEHEQLARILHALGIILHYADDPRLRHNAVLDPHWVTNGVYTLLRLKDGPRSDGILTVDEAVAALMGERRDMVEYLIGLMRRFELCFSLDADEQRWFVPQLLQPFQPMLGNEWQTSNATRLRYRYEVLTEGILPRFIVRTHPLSETGPRWRNGVVLRLDGASALIRADRARHDVTIVGIGDPIARLDLIKLIRGHFTQINRSLPGLQGRDELEIEGHPGVFKSVKVLLTDERKDRRSTIETTEGSEEIDHTRELNRVSAPASRNPLISRIRVFISYSQKDARLLDIFRANLDLLREDGLLDWWYDGLIAPSAEWDTEIRREIEQADIVIFLVSTPFLATKYIRGVEMACAARRRALNQVELASILLEDHTDWLTKRKVTLLDSGQELEVDFGKYQSLLPKGRTVRSYENVRTGFNVAAKALGTMIADLVRRRARQKS